MPHIPRRLDCVGGQNEIDRPTLFVFLASSEAEICCRSSVCSGFCSSTSKTLRTQVFIVEIHFRGGVKHLTFLHGSVGPVRRQRVWLLFAEKRLRHFTF